jgi:hypothetical protein
MKLVWLHKLAAILTEQAAGKSLHRMFFTESIRQNWQVGKQLSTCFTLNR